MSVQENSISLKWLFLVFFVIFFSLFVYYFQVKPNFSEITELKSNRDLVIVDNNEVISQMQVCLNLTEDEKKSCELKNTICVTDDCKYNKARLLLNESSCFDIKNESLRISCSFSVSLDSTFQMAVLKDNLNLCNDLESSLVITNCKNNYYFAKSINSKNQSYCEFIDGVNLKNECYKK